MEAIAAVIAVLVAAVGFALCSFGSGALLFGKIPWVIAQYLTVLISFFVPLGVAFSVWQYSRKRLDLPPRIIETRWLRVMLACAYICTLFFGIPAVHTQLLQDEVSEYKRVRDEGRRVWPVHPRIEVTFSAPVFPFLIVTHHDYQLAGLYGWGGWEIHVWYIFGVQSVAQFTEWVS